MSDDDGFVYIGIWEGLRVAVVVDDPTHREFTAKELRGFIRRGYTIERESFHSFREKGLASYEEIDAMKKRLHATKVKP